MNKGVLIFGGTSEGRELAENMSRRGKKAHVLTATAYGGRLVEHLAHITVHAGRLDADAMYCFMRDHGIGRVVDATHPYAAEATRNIQSAAARAGIEYIRVMRNEGRYAGIASVASAARAADFLRATEGPVLLTIGSKELEIFCAPPALKERLYARVLPMPEVAALCHALGLRSEQVIAARGPFSYEMNAALMRRCKCAWLVTKNSGAAGGMDEKVTAALDAGVGVLVIDRPLEEHGISIHEALRLLGVCPVPALRGREIPL